MMDFWLASGLADVWDCTVYTINTVLSLTQPVMHGSTAAYKLDYFNHLPSILLLTI